MYRTIAIATGIPVEMTKSQIKYMWLFLHVLKKSFFNGTSAVCFFYLCLQVRRSKIAGSNSNR